MSDEPIRITLPGMRVSVIRDGDKGAADFYDARGDSRSAWNKWGEWEEFSLKVLEQRFPAIRAILEAAQGQMP